MKLRLVAVALLLACLGAAPAASPAVANPNVGANVPSPIAKAKLYVDLVDQQSLKAFVKAFYEGRTEDAKNLRKIARHSIFRWIGKTDENPQRAASKFLAKVQREQPGAVAGITVLNHVGERCKGRYDAGGRRENRRYRSWIDGFVRGLGNARVIVGFEPDSLGTLKCLVPAARRARLSNMKYGIDKLAKLPNATVYIEATASDWRPAREVARYLRAVNIRKVRGFMLNVTHLDYTSRNVRYGQRLSKLVGGKNFVVNTDENGSGRQTYRKFNRRTRKFDFFNVYCNPTNSSLGHPPTTTRDLRGNALPNKVDGYLWISRPAASAGSCRQYPGRYAMRGGPNAGTFWLKRALILAERSRFE